MSKIMTPEQVFALKAQGLALSFLSHVTENFTWREVLGTNPEHFHHEVTLGMLQQALRVAKVLEELRKREGAPIVPTSWLRVPSHNDKVSKSGRDGPHTTGNAVDFTFLGKDNVAIYNRLAKTWKGGHALKVKGGRVIFIHLDMVRWGKPRTWAY
jgi:uncharacterized protein YcbK (DUF882 family)